MLSSAQVEETLQAQVEAVKAAWGVAVTYRNSDNSSVISTGVPFVEVDVNINNFNQITLGAVGSRTYRRTGTLSITAFVKDNTGTRQIRTILDNVLNTFEGKTFSGIVCESASNLPVGSVNGWFAEIILVNFFYNSEGI